MSQVTEQEESNDNPLYSFAEFLESVPPNTHAYIAKCGRYFHSPRDASFVLAFKMPDVQLHCDSNICGGLRIFRGSEGEEIVLAGNFTEIYLRYRCSNCRESAKVFSVAIMPKGSLGEAEAIKFGEHPVFGPPVPSRLLKMIGPDRDEFLKGKRCENQGLGVGAFTYYRRVVENQKSRIFSEIIKVGRKIGISNEKLVVLEAAEKESQISKALDMAKDALPESLLMNGKSPIKLLYAALSEGVHNLSDEQCLEIATSVRVVLAELAEKLSQALKDEAELSKALKVLETARSKVK